MFFLSRGQIKETAFQRFLLEKTPPFQVRFVYSLCPKLWFLKKIKTTWRQHGTLESNPPILKSCNKTIHSKWIHGPRPAFEGFFSQKRWRQETGGFSQSLEPPVCQSRRFVWHSYDGQKIFSGKKKGSQVTSGNWRSKVEPCVFPGFSTLLLFGGSQQSLIR